MALLAKIRSWLAGLFGSAAHLRPDGGPDLSTQEALRDSEERLRLVRRATGLGMYEIDWIARRRYWSPELREILRVPPDVDINADTDLLEQHHPDRHARALPREAAGLARAGKRGRLRR